MEILTDLEIEFANVIDLDQEQDIYIMPDWMMFEVDHKENITKNHKRTPLRFE